MIIILYLYFRKTALIHYTSIMSTLSIVMIVKNEAECLRNCLSSVKAIADEIIIADTGSTDETVSIAEDFGAKVFNVEWHNDFAEARNKAIEFATCDWILHLDADEIVDENGSRTIREIVDSDGLGADAVELTLANYCNTPRAWRWVPCEPDDPMSNGFSGYIAVGLLRLFRNGRGYEYREPVHENITESVVENGGVIGSAEAIIHHYGYSPDSEEISDSKARLYLEIARKKVDERPEDPKAWRDLAEQEYALGDVAAAENACNKVLSLDDKHVDGTTLLANIYLNRGELDQARSLLEKLEQQIKTPAHIVMTLGAIACRQGRLDEAVERLEKVLSEDPRSILAMFYLARTFDRLGEVPKAREQLKMALKIAPGLQEIQDRVRSHKLRQEGEDLFKKGESSEALETLVESLHLDSEDPLTHNDIGVVLNILGQKKEAKESFERALKLAPGMSEAKDNLLSIRNDDASDKSL